MTYIIKNKDDVTCPPKKSSTFGSGCIHSGAHSPKLLTTGLSCNVRHTNDGSTLGFDTKSPLIFLFI